MEWDGIVWTHRMSRTDLLDGNKDDRFSEHGHIRVLVYAELHVRRFHGGCTQEELPAEGRARGMGQSGRSNV